MADLDAVDELVVELQALHTRLALVEATLDGATRPGRHPPSLPELAQRIATLERRAGVVQGLAPLPGLGQPARESPEPAVATQTLDWHERLLVAGAVAALAVLLLWLAHPSLPTRRAQEAVPVPTQPVAVPATPAWLPAFSQGYYAPGPFDFREDHRQPAFIPATPVSPLVPNTVLCPDAC